MRRLTNQHPDMQWQLHPTPNTPTPNTQYSHTRQHRDVQWQAEMSDAQWTSTRYEYQEVYNRVQVGRPGGRRRRQQEATTADAISGDEGTAWAMWRQCGDTRSGNITLCIKSFVKSLTGKATERGGRCLPEGTEAILSRGNLGLLSTSCSTCPTLDLLSTSSPTSSPRCACSAWHESMSPTWGPRTGSCTKEPLPCACAKVSSYRMPSTCR